MINKSILFGYLAADPEARYTKTGKCICSLRLAHKENFKDDSKEPLYINVDVWDKQGETCAKALKKGSNVIVDGRLSSDSYENKEGKKVTKMFIVADRVTFVPRFEKSESSNSAPAKGGNEPIVKQAPAPVSDESQAGGEGEESDDIPF